MTSYAFTDLLNRAPSEIRNNAADARSWLTDNMSQTISPSKMLEKDPDKPRLQRTPQGGNLNMFMYDAKTKQKLPYFDRFPLIFYTGPAPGGFMGMNLHYLPPLLRAKLFDSVQGSNNQGAIIAAASKLKYYKPCIKRYLNKHVKSRFVVVYPDEWNLAIFLPTERFSGARKGRVFSDTIGKI